MVGVSGRENEARGWQTVKQEAPMKERHGERKVRYRRNKKSRAKKLKPTVESNMVSGSRMPRVKIKECRARVGERTRARILASNFELMCEGGLFLFPFRSANEIPFYKRGVLVCEDVATQT